VVDQVSHQGAEVQEVIEAREEAESPELSEEDLEKVAGGVPGKMLLLHFQLSEKVWGK
jgi:hypothetical protein